MSDFCKALGIPFDQALSLYSRGFPTRQERWVRGAEDKNDRDDLWSSVPGLLKVANAVTVSSFAADNSRVSENAKRFANWLTDEAQSVFDRWTNYGTIDAVQVLSDPVILRRLLSDYARKAERMEARAQASSDAEIARIYQEIGVLEGEVATLRRQIERIKECVPWEYLEPVLGAIQESDEGIRS